MMILAGAVVSPEHPQMTQHSALDLKVSNKQVMSFSDLTVTTKDNRSKAG